MSLIDRTGAAALMPEEVAAEIIKDTPQASAALTMFRRTTMSRKQKRMPVLSAFPQAYWVNGDTGRKQTTASAWENKYLDAEELAVICPIPEAVLDDTDYDIWGELRPELVTSFGQKIDQAVLFGVDKPSSWPEAISDGCDRTDHEIKLGENVDFAEDVNQAMGLVEADGFDISGHLARTGVKARLRGLRDANDQPIFLSSLRDDKRADTLYGEPITFLKNGAWEPSDADLLTGDFTQGVVAIRQDITYKILTEATITDGAGNVVYSLAEQDMVALRAVMRVAWQIANPKTRENDDDDTRYPFSIVRPAAWVGSAGSKS